MHGWRGWRRWDHVNLSRRKCAADTRTYAEAQKSSADGITMPRLEVVGAMAKPIVRAIAAKLSALFFDSFHRNLSKKQADVIESAIEDESMRFEQVSGRGEMRYAQRSCCANVESALCSDDNL